MCVMTESLPLHLIKRVIAKYANAVSEQIIELWKEVGLGTFCDGCSESGI